MLQSIKSLIGLGQGASSSTAVSGAADAACAGCSPEILAKCSAAEPASVTPHTAHVFIKLAAPSGSAAAAPAASDESWWPESVDQ